MKMDIQEKYCDKLDLHQRERLASVELLLERKQKKMIVWTAGIALALSVVVVGSIYVIKRMKD